MIATTGCTRPASCPRRTPFATVLALALMLAAASAVRAGDFLYYDGVVRDGWYAGTIYLGDQSATESGSCDADYPGALDRVQYTPIAEVCDWSPDGPGTAVIEFYNKGWAADMPGVSNPMFGFIYQGSAEFEMEAQLHAWSNPAEPSQTFAAGYGSGPVRIDSTTGNDGLAWELMPDAGFNEDADDYIRVGVYLNLAYEMWCDGTMYTEPFSNYNTDLEGRTTGPGDIDDVQILRNGEVVWEANVDDPLDALTPTANVSIVARFGDTIGVCGGVITEMDLASRSILPNDPGEGAHSWSTTVTLHGEFNLTDVPGSKAEKPLMPVNLFEDFPHQFDALEVGQEELGVDDPLWFATWHAEAYIIETVDPFGSDEVIEGVCLPELGDFVFEVWIVDPSTGEEVLVDDAVSPDETVYFLHPVDTVIVKGFEDDPAWPMVTPVGLLFTPLSEPSVFMTGVPEPATLMLMAAGLAGLSARRRRRRRRRRAPG